MKTIKELAAEVFERFHVKMEESTVLELRSSYASDEDFFHAVAKCLSPYDWQDEREISGE